MKVREAGPDDADAIAALHADSWRTHYRGAYVDSYLDGNVRADRLSVWRDRLAHPAHRVTSVAEDDGSLLGFAHLIVDDDRTWGALLENIHVGPARKRRGVGTMLLAEMARRLGEQRPSSGMYLWVLEQNVAAQAFYLARGGAIVERELRGPFPGGGTAFGLRVAWAAPGVVGRWAPDAGLSPVPGTDDDAVVVRPATAEDVDAIVRLYGQLAEDRPAALPPELEVARRRFGEIARQANRVLLVAALGGTVEATADLVIVANLTHGGDPWAVVENVVVDESTRRKGVGAALMQEVVRRSEVAGCYKIQLLSRKHRHQAHAFYATLGFDPVAEGFRRYLR